MKPIRFPNSPVTKPKPPAPPPPPAASVAASTLPPPPPHVVPPMPPPVEAPKDYDGYVEAALKARVGRTDMAQLWAMLAQADATSRLADQMKLFLGFIGAFDADPEDESDEPRLQDAIGMGVVDAALTLKDRFLAMLPPDIVAEFKGIIQARMKEALAEIKQAGTPRPGLDIFTEATKPEGKKKD